MKFSKLLCCLPIFLSSLSMGALWAQSVTSETIVQRNNISIPGPKVKTQNGILEGVYEPSAGLETFKGVPYALPPVGNLRWKEPQPLKNWKGIRVTKNFGPKAMQKPLFSDMQFRSNGTSEDCLYLNIWKPAENSVAKSKGKSVLISVSKSVTGSAILLPVLVYFYGGGFKGGDGSEYRYDGADLARKGIITITVNYRLGIFGFLAHPELSVESGHHASGNYGLQDQTAALRWVSKNISAFGGDPSRVTIAGESAGSISVFAQMATPLSRNLFAAAIGESGAMIKPTFIPVSLDTAEHNGLDFMTRAGLKNLKAMRAMPAKKLLDLEFNLNEKLPAVIDGYFFKEIPALTFAAGRQAKVPLLVGWNSAEGGYGDIIHDSITPDHYASVIKHVFGSSADKALILFPGTDEKTIKQSATDLASDMFIVYSTWKWADLQAKTSGKPVYRYLFSRIRQTADDRKKPLGLGASHSSEIEYALGNLSTNKVFDWNADDFKVSATMEGYFANFIKTGNPNGNGLPTWQALNINAPIDFINIDVETKMQQDINNSRFNFLEEFYNK